MLIPSLIQHKRDGNADRGRRTGLAWSPTTRPARFPTIRCPPSSWPWCSAASRPRSWRRSPTPCWTRATGSASTVFRCRGWTSTPPAASGDKVSLLLAPMVAALRRGGADDVGPRAGAHRRHPRQVGVHTRNAHGALAGGRPGPGRADRLRHAGADPGDRAGGPEALRAAGRDRDGGIHPAHLREHHVEEAGRGAQRAGARREDRQRGVHPRSRPRDRAGHAP